MSANGQRFFVDVKNGLQWESENIIFSSVENALHFANNNFPQNKWRIVDNSENVRASSSGLTNLESDANEQLNRFHHVEKTRRYYEDKRRRWRPIQDQRVVPNEYVFYPNEWREEDERWIRINRQSSPQFPFDFFKSKKQKNEYEDVDWMKEGF